MVAIVVTAPPLGHANPSSLRLRIVSAMVMAPAVLAAVWLGPPYFPALIVAAGAVLGWEWAGLCGRGRVGTVGIPAIAAIVGAALLASAGWALAALILAGLGSLVVGWSAPRRAEAVLAAGGVLWISVPSIALLWLSQDPTVGRRTVLWLLAIVWATDIGAYIVGRTLGGPRLAPRMSPNKTWSGLAGGVACAALAGAAAAWAFGAPLLSPLPLASALLAVIEQSGDLAESLAKRHFGVKDASGLIPGHGGLLDRVDGLLAVVPAVALLNLIGGSSVVTWRWAV
jgi:phosphatidate cytidylyltransferase